MSSATYQLAGGSIYRFRGNHLTIVFTSGDKDGRLPSRTTITDYDFQFDDSTRPARLIIYRLGPTGQKVVESVEAAEFKDGQMWLTLRQGWVTGLRRIAMPPVTRQAAPPQEIPRQGAPQQAPRS